MDPTETLTTRLAGALADLGLSHAVISPGSRSTPLATAFAVEDRITCHVVHDERSAGFFGLGIAKQSGIPAALVCTSGTAAANYLPAVVEANQARVPLIVITADRPPELRGVGAPQTIDQAGIYGTNVRLFHECGVPDEATAAAAPALAMRAWTRALDAPHGPVHLNIALREPLGAASQPAPPMSLRHHRGEVQLPPEDLTGLADRLSGRKVLIVAGGHQRPGFAAATAMLAGEAGIPVVADVQSRFPSPSTITNGDLLAASGFMDSQTPDIIVRVGPIPTSRPVWSWLSETDAQQISVDDDGGEGLNSRLVFTFPETGDYVVRARTFGTDATGPYTIELSELGPPPPPPPPIRIRPGRTASGELTIDSATYEADSYGGSDRHYALYELRGREGDTRTITLRSDDFDAFLEIGAMSPLGFAVVDSNDDGMATGEEESLGLDSRLTVTFQQSGRLTIRATTLGGGATGAYTLTVE